MSQSLNCVIINPGDLDSYVSTVKQSLLYFDHIHLIPVFDLLHLGLTSIQTQISSGSSAATPGIQMGMLDVQNKIFNQVKSRSRKPSNKGLKKIIDKESKRLVEKQFKRNIDQQSMLRGVQAMSEMNLDKIRCIESQLEPAIKSELLTVNADHADAEQLKDALKAAVEVEIKKALVLCGCELTGTPLPELEGSQGVLLSYSGKQAAAMTSIYDCPLMTSSTDFMRHLSLNMKSVPPSKWLSKDVVQKQWRESSLSLTVSDRELPTFDGLDIEDVLEVRRVVGDELGYYRLKLAEFAETLRSAPWDKDFQKEAKALLDSEIRPAIEAARVAFLQDPPFPYRIKKALKAAKSERRRLNQIAEFLPIPEPIIAWTGFCAGVDKYIEEKYLYQPDKSVRNGMLFMVKARTILQ